MTLGRLRRRYILGAAAGAWALAMPMPLGLRERLEKPARS